MRTPRAPAGLRPIAGTFWPAKRPVLSVRLRLTLWYMVVLTASLLIFGMALYFLLERALTAEADQATIARAQDVARELEARVWPPTDPIDSAPDIIVQVIDIQTGQIVARSTNLTAGDLSPRPDVLDAVLQGQTRFGTIGPSSHRFRVYNLPLTDRGRIVGVAQIGRSLVADDELLRRLRILLITMIGLGVPATVVLGWVLAGRALAPIEEIAGATEAIGQARAFSQRIAYSSPGDELGHLATTINSMLAELEASHRDIASSNARLRQALAAHQRFVADASHELRTPLTTIRINVELLQSPESGNDRDGCAKALADIVEEAERMSRLVSDLLTLARADAGQSLERHPLELRPLVDDAVRQGRLLMRGKRLESGRLADVVIVGNADALKQLLLILLDNAAKYTRNGDQITVALWAVDGHAVLNVRDSGCGIEAEDLPRVFERFFRATATREVDGSGLGLAIAHWIVEQHSGRAMVTSDIGRGSTFTVTFPLYQPVDAALL